MTVCKNSFGAKAHIKINGNSLSYFSLNILAGGGFSNIHRLPFSIKILLENLLRNEDTSSFTAKDIENLALWNTSGEMGEMPFLPARVLLQDFTGVPAVVDLAAMRDATNRLYGDPLIINPLIPAELIIDHSVQVDSSGKDSSLEENLRYEFMRNSERYTFLRWGQKNFDNFRVVPPGTGICHQVNLEHLARVVFIKEIDGELPQEVGLFFLFSGILGTFVPTETHIEKVKKDIAKASAGIRAQDFQATPDKRTCEMCPFSRYCDDSVV